MPTRDPRPALGATVPLSDVRAELASIEALDREVGALTTHLRAALTPEQFRLVWALHDAVERLALAEELLRARHAPGAARAGP